MLECDFRKGHEYTNSFFMGLRIWGKYETPHYMGERWFTFSKMRNPILRLLNPYYLSALPILIVNHYPTLMCFPDPFPIL